MHRQGTPPSKVNKTNKRTRSVFYKDLYAEAEKTQNLISVGNV